MEGLLAKFLPRFLALAHDRLRNGLEVATNRWRDRAEGIAHELHALAGEAGLLGLEGVVDHARTAEEAARRFGGTGDEDDATSLVESLKRLENAVTNAAHGMGG
jgi:HPt (histidine-containing phosphotransfer) domain-containing protein